MKKYYIKPQIGKGSLMSEELLVTASLSKGEDISSGTVEADSRKGSFWEDSE